MPLIETSHESLPYIDADLTASQRADAQALIDAELSSSSSAAKEHPLLPFFTIPTPSPFIAIEYARLSSSSSPPSLSGISTTHYEALSTPSSTDPLSTWQETLSQAYASQVYLSSRLAALQKLDVKGKEEWLAANEGLLALLAGLEKELQKTREEIDSVVLERRAAQESVKEEMEGLERSWKEGVGRVLEVEVAAEDLRERILEERRAGRGREKLAV